MKIRVDTPIVTLDGKPFEGEGTPASLRAALYGCLVAPLPTDTELTLEGKLKVHQLAKHVLRSGTDSGCIEFTPEQLAEVRSRAARYYTPHFFGQIADLLEEGLAPGVAPA